MLDKVNELKPILNFAAVDYWYHNKAHSEIQLMTRLSKHTKVLFINSIGMRAPIPGRTTKSGFRILRKIKSLFRGLRKPLPELDNFYVFTPLIIPAYSTPPIRKINFILITLQIKTVCKILSIKNPIVFETIPTACEITPKLQPAIEVVNRVDKMSAFSETDSTYIESLEEKQIQRAHRTYYTSTLLLDDEIKWHEGKGKFLDHGIDLNLFSIPDPKEERPEELKNLRGKIIGFFGGIDDYVIDIDLLKRIEQNFKDDTLVLIGEATCDISDLTNKENVVHLGMQPVEKVAKLGAHFDVAILPRLNDEWTKYTNPIKIKEYLALGLDIVTMDIPEVRRYGNYLRIAKNNEDFIAEIKKALNNPLDVASRSAKRSLVQNDTWDIRCDEVLADLQELLLCAE